MHVAVHLIARHQALQLELGVACHHRREGSILVQAALEQQWNVHYLRSN